MTGEDVAGRDVLFADALVVSGSHTDVHPRVYGQAPTPLPRGDLDARCDWSDLAVLRAALRADVPLVGVCRGHQLLNVLSSGTLFQDVGLAGPLAGRAHDRGARREHRRLEHGAVARRPPLVGAERAPPGHPPPRALAAGRRRQCRRPGRVRERTDRRFAVGVQWKPPLAPDDGPSRRLAEALVEHAGARRRAA
ncbi:MAG TPA: gamma-glutamyl-gamma-aminobutyrate hydrolase family protein [Solirubrobacteraceae bacterium]|nr:gamma-glutamyl-gamma-aminobutyrate hydrolase family protein [Solirubrobacteraceae bacterium]